MSNLTSYTSATRPSAIANTGLCIFRSDTEAIEVSDGTGWLVYNYDSKTYALDGSNLISVAPTMHFDAYLLDGSDHANNPSDGTGVSTYGDRSGNATNFDATQSTAANQPTYKEDASGLSFVRVAANDYMALTNSKSIGSSDDLTVIQVAKRTADWYSTIILDSSQYSYLEAAYYLIGTNSHYMMGTLDSSTTFTRTDLNSLHILVSQRSGGSFKVWLNSGSAKITGVTNSSSATYDRLFQGSNTDAVKGDYYETLYFDSALSLLDMNTVRSYLSSKYSITSSAFS
jgi:hypothetical protein